jgi:hypothetical protein
VAAPWIGVDPSEDTRLWWSDPEVLSPPGSGPWLKWWDSALLIDVELIGWWDGSTVSETEILGWWNGVTIELLEQTGVPAPDGGDAPTVSSFTFDGGNAASTATSTLDGGTA